MGISGSYGGLNMGDEAILTSMIAQLRASVPAKITVFSRDPGDTLRRHSVDNAVPVREMSRTQARRVIESLDVFVLGGGGILYDDDAETYMREVELAYEAGVPVMVHAVGVGPLNQHRVRAHVRHAVERADAVTVRDGPSRRLLDEIGLRREVVVTADPAVLLEPEPLTLDEILRAEAIDPRARLIGMSVREPGPAAPTLNVEHYHQLLANAADFMAARLDADLVFVPLERRNDDVQHSHGVIARMRHAQSATVLKREYSPGQLVSLLGHFEFAVGMRLHFLILSALAGVPFVALPYATKVRGLLEDLDIAALAVEQVSTGQLIAAIDEAWDLRDGLRAHVARSFASLRRRARRNNAQLLELLGVGEREKETSPGSNRWRMSDTRTYWSSAEGSAGPPRRSRRSGSASV